jgi:hypothetical protein
MTATKAKRHRPGRPILSALVDETVKVKAHKVAAEHGVSVSDIVRAGIDAELERRRVQAVLEDEITLLANGGREDAAAVLDDDNNKETRGVT